MLLVKNLINMLRYNKKGGAGTIIGGIIITLIIVIGIIIAISIYTNNQTHPFWEIK